MQEQKFEGRHTWPRVCTGRTVEASASYRRQAVGCVQVSYCVTCTSSQGTAFGCCGRAPRSCRRVARQRLLVDFDRAPETSSRGLRCCRGRLRRRRISAQAVAKATARIRSSSERRVRAQHEGDAELSLTEDAQGYAPRTFGTMRWGPRLLRPSCDAALHASARAAHCTAALICCKRH